MTSLPTHAAAEGIYRGQALDPANPAFWTAEVCRIQGDVDFDRLCNSIIDTVLDADALHTRFTEQAEKVTQIVTPDRSWRPEVVELAESATWPQIRQAAAERLHTAPDLSVGGLFAVTLFRSSDTVWWLTRAHHIVLDGYGYGLIYRQVSRRYRRNLRPGDRFGRLADFVTADVTSRRDVETDRRHWERRLRDVPIRGFSDHLALPSHETVTHRHTFADTPLAGAGAAWPHRLMAATAAALHRHTGETDVVLGVPVADRLGTPGANIPAMVMNIAALPVRVEPQDRLDHLQDRVSTGLRNDRRHQRYRYERLRRDLGLGNGRIFGAVVNVVPFADPPRLPGADVTMHHISAGPVDDLVITARDPSAFTVEANPRSYSLERIRHIADDIAAVLNSDRTVERWELLPAEPAVSPVDWRERLREHASNSPTALALTDDGRHWNYRQLYDAVQHAASVLVDKGVGPGDLVAVCLPRSAEAVIAILAIGYAAAGYLPLDPDAGPERNARILAEAKPTLTIDHELSTSMLSGPVTETDGQPARRPLPDDIAYIIYTSGSTGAPKGVRIPHRALDHFVAAAGHLYRFGPNDRVLQFAPLHFDAHVEELFPTVAAGATLVVRDRSATDSLQAFVDFVDEHRVTVLDLPTAYWHEMALALHNRLVRLPSSIRTVIIGGEAADDTRVSQWHESVGGDVRLLNTYGPTETTVVCLAGPLVRGKPVELGRPLAGVDAAVGSGGELFIGGPTLTTGYVGGVETDRLVERDGTAWYRTGDVVEKVGDTLRFAGRTDDEVKIDGHRIHPREVEAALMECDGVDEAAVTMPDGGARLTAYIAGTAEATGVQAEIARKLPQAAVPGTIHVLDRLFRTRSGKIDRQRLSALQPSQSADTPRDRWEKVVHDVFTEVLGSTPPTRHTDFFGIGGTSLSAVAVANRLSTAVDAPVTAAQVFEHPTVMSLAAALTGRTSTESRFSHDREWKLIGEAGATSNDRMILTGATGFVGIHVLSAFLRDTDATVTCLSRGGMARLYATADAYGLPRPSAERVHVVDCDFTQPGLGLTSADRRRLTGARTIVHCAAQVSLNRGYDSLRTVNVVATGDLLRLAYDGGSHFHHVSTVAVGGPHRLPEDFVDAHDGLSDGYQQSKWLAEDMLRHTEERGLSVACYRLGRVTASTDTGALNPGDFVSQLVAASDLVAALPNLPVTEPQMAADLTATAITGLVQDESRGVWNLTLGPPVELTALLTRLRPGLSLINLTDWRERLSECDDEQAQAVATFFALRDSAPPVAAPRIDNERFRSWWDRRG